VAIDELSQNPFEVSNRFARKSFLDSVVLHGIPPHQGGEKPTFCCDLSDSAKLSVFA
jgi:hypothetical protein